MNWEAFWLTVRLATIVSFVLLAIGIPIAYWLTYSRWRWKFLVEAAVAREHRAVPSHPRRRDAIEEIDATQNALAPYDAIYWIAGGKPKAGGIETLAPLLMSTEPSVVSALASMIPERLGKN